MGFLFNIRENSRRFTPPQPFTSKPRSRFCWF